MFSFFKRKAAQPELPKVEDFSFLGVDMHSHLIAGVDDGAPTLDDSLKLIETFHRLGYRKLITTPHVMSDFYKNSKETLLSGLEDLKKHVAASGLDIELEVAAEYYLDNYFLELLGEGLLTFGDNYILVEVGMAGWPRQFDDCIFSAIAQGYKPILAHPERYLFEGDINFYKKLKEKGVLMQLNMLSITGYYGKPSKMMAEHFLKEGIYDFCGSDMHHERHAGRMAGMPEMGQHDLQLLASYGKFRNQTL